MRTTIDIDEELLRQAEEASGCKTKKATVEAALRELVWRKTLADFDAIRGPGLFWPDYDYKAMREAD